MEELYSPAATQSGAHTYRERGGRVRKRVRVRERGEKGEKEEKREKEERGEGGGVKGLVSPAIFHHD